MPCLGISDTDKALHKSILVHHLKHGNIELSILHCLTGLAWPVLVANLLCTLHQENNNSTVIIPPKQTFVHDVTLPVYHIRLTRSIPGNSDSFHCGSFGYSSFDYGCIQILLVLGAGIVYFMTLIIMYQDFTIIP